MLLSVIYWADSSTRVVGGRVTGPVEERLKRALKRARREGSGGDDIVLLSEGDIILGVGNRRERGEWRREEGCIGGGK